MYHTIYKANGNMSNLQFIMTTTNKRDLVGCTQKISGTFLYVSLFTLVSTGPDKK